MRLLLTGLNGTLAPRLAAHAGARGWEVLGWNRQQIPPEDEAAAAAWLAAQRVDAIAHLAFGAESWAAQLAAYAAARGLPFLFTSTAMVFDHKPDGPHRPGDPRTAQDDYGRYKIRCEDAVRAHHRAACIARLGWQIDPAARGNNMVAALDAQQARELRIRASTRWTPACSFIEDTVAALLRLLEAPPGATVHLDSNAREGHSFADLVRALRRALGRQQWVVEPTADYVHDQRLLDAEERLPGLAARLPELRSAAAS
jgi:dTDP-4-dehydrorhamnose reductase